MLYRSQHLNFLRNAGDVSATVNLVGVQAATGIGAAVGAVLTALTGVQATSGIGTIQATYQPVLVGVQAVAGIATFTPNVQPYLTGVESTASAGTVTPNVQPYLTGVGSTAYISGPVLDHDAVVQGTSATAGIGRLLPIATVNQTSISLPSAKATSGIGSITISHFSPLIGASARAGIGSITTLHFVGGLRLGDLIVQTIPGNTYSNDVSLRWSDTKGVSWSNAVERSLGAEGEYLTDVQWRRLGLARDRVFEVSWSADSMTSLTGAFVTTEKSGT